MTDPADLHRSILTLDSHIDIPWPSGPDDDPFADTTTRRVDLPKMQRGGVRAGCFAAYVPQGGRTAESYAAAGERALAMLDAIGGMGRAHPQVARLCSTADEIERAHADGTVAIVPAVENGHAMGEDLGLLAAFRARGARYVTLTHNGHNALADAAIPRRDLGDAESLHGGLSGLGKQAVAEMNRLGLLVDVSHLSRQSMLQSAMLSRTPVVATHSCVRALCDHPRNLDDTQLDALRDTEGLIQITAMPSFLKPRAHHVAGRRVGLHRPPGLCGAPDRCRACRDQFRTSTAAARSAAGAMPPKAWRSPQNWCAAAMAIARSHASGAAIFYACCATRSASRKPLLLACRRTKRDLSAARNRAASRISSTNRIDSLYFQRNADMCPQHDAISAAGLAISMTYSVCLKSGQTVAAQPSRRRRDSVCRSPTDLSTALVDALNAQESPQA